MQKLLSVLVSSLHGFRRELSFKDALTARVGHYFPKALACALLCAGFSGPLKAQPLLQLDLPERPVEDPKKDEGLGDLDKGKGAKPRSLKGSLNPGASGKSNSSGESGTGGDLELPEDVSGRAPNSAGSDVTSPGSASSPSLTGELAPSGANPAERVKSIFERVSAIEDVDDPALFLAVSGLSEVGAEGLLGARVRLSAEKLDHSPTFLASAWTLMLAGSDGDWGFVRERMHRRMPSHQLSPMLRKLLEVDPVRASPELHVSLLDHPQNITRAVAHNRLKDMDSELVLPHLMEAMGARRTDTRLRALDLAAAAQPPMSLDVLLFALNDPSAKVAHRAAWELSSLESRWAVDPLLKRAFQSRWILRDSSYALIALMYREDLLFEDCLNESHIPALLGGLRSRDSFVAGTTAAALAGIGFKSPSVKETWLNREVPERLLIAVAGLEFHSDFSSLQRTASRRLGLLAGAEPLNGPAWVEWWQANGRDFQPRRAWIEAQPEDAGRLVLRVRLGGSSAGPQTGRTYQLLGPDYLEEQLAAQGKWMASGESLILSPSQASDLFELCRAEQLLSARRLPGMRGDFRGVARTIELEIDGNTKSFSFAEAQRGAENSEVWFDRILEVTSSLRERNLWQLYSSDADSVGVMDWDRWNREYIWWETPRPREEWAKRLKDRVLDWLPDQSDEASKRGLQLLVDLYGEEQAAEAGDYGTLSALLAQERIMNDRSRTLVQLSMQSAAAEPEGELERNLFELLLDNFGASAGSEIVAVLEKAGRGEIRSAAVDARPFARAVAAAALCKDPEEQDYELIRKLLRDSVEAVELEAVDAIGRNQLQELRTEVMVRARIGRVPVRAASLRALGLLGGSSSTAILARAIREGNQLVRSAAAEGLAELGDPSVAPLLIQSLMDSGDTQLYHSARRGLANLGSDAWPDLLRVINTPKHPALKESALVLSRQGVADAAPAMIRYLTEHPTDRRIMDELAVLTGRDFARSPEPVTAWWEWWDNVVHDQPFAWFQAGLLLAGLDAPPPDELEQGGEAVMLFLLRVLDRSEEHLVERSRRELGRLLGADLGDLPADELDRAAWLFRLRETILSK